MTEIYALVKTTYNRENEANTCIMAAYSDRADLDKRVQNIAEANSQYKMTTTSPNSWRVGPDEDEDEGFFGDSPVYLHVEKVKLYG